MDHLDARNRKLTFSVFVVCFGYMICTMPHVIYGYTGENYAENGGNTYKFTLGLFWLQYAFNVYIYMAQKDQYWNAYKDYIEEVILSKIGYKWTRNESNFESESALQQMPLSSKLVQSPQASKN